MKSEYIVYRAIRRWQTGTFMLLSFDDIPELGTHLTMTNGYYDEPFKAIASEVFIDSDGEQFVKITYQGTLTNDLKSIFFENKEE